MLFRSSITVNLRAILSIWPPEKLNLLASSRQSPILSDDNFDCHILALTSGLGLFSSILYKNRRSKALSRFEVWFVVANIIPLKFSISSRRMFWMVCSVLSTFPFKSFFLLLNSYYRLINNAIVYTNNQTDGSKINLSASQIDDASHIGGTLAIGTELFKIINLKLWNMSQYALINDSKSDAFPLFYSGIDASYTQTVGRSEFTIGFDWAFQSKSKPMKYFSMQNAYLQSNDTQSASHNGLNLYATARLGSAFVKISFMNALNSEYYTLSLYPMPGRNLKFSVHWDFFD